MAKLSREKEIWEYVVKLKIVVYWVSKLAITTNDDLSIRAHEDSRCKLFHSYL